MRQSAISVTIIPLAVWLRVNGNVPRQTFYFSVICYTLSSNFPFAVWLKFLSSGKELKLRSCGLWFMGKQNKNRARDPLSIPVRQLKRICISVDTLLRQKLCLEVPSHLSDPLPVSEAEVIAFLETVSKKSE